MFTIIFIAKNSILDLLPIRLFLKTINLNLDRAQDYIPHQILYPFNKNFEKQASNQSLTLQSIGKNTQIRFILIQEINKYWGLILDQILNKYSSLDIKIYQSQHLGEGSKSFFDRIAKSFNVKVCYYPFQNPDSEASLLEDLELTEEEKWILEKTQFPSLLTSLEQKILFDYAHRYLSIGDSWTCLNINTLLLPHQPKFLERIYEDLGMAYNALTQTYQAEFFIEKWVESSAGENRIAALYVYSVILSRYLPLYFKDYKKALDCFEEASKCLQNLEQLVSLEEFMHLKNIYNFTLNGKAYILFQQKRYKEAINILLEGIYFIDKNPNLKLPMSYSLFFYNLAQGYKQINNKEKVLETYNQLLKLDPQEASYYVDFATYYIDLKDFDKALELIDKSLEINSNLPTAHAALGYLYFQQEKLNESESHYKKAFDVIPNNLEYLYHYAYSLALQEKYQYVIELLDTNDWQLSDKKAWLQSSKSYYIDFLFLYVEGLTFCNQIETAYQILKDAHSKFPNHLQIQENLKLLEDNFNNVLQKAS